MDDGTWDHPGITKGVEKMKKLQFGNHMQKDIHKYIRKDIQKTMKKEGFNNFWRRLNDLHLSM